jgi:hypothetical protein
MQEAARVRRGEDHGEKRARAARRLDLELDELWAEPGAERLAARDEAFPRYAAAQQAGRRTVVITGRPGPAHYERRSAVAAVRPRRRSPAAARIAGRPDRLALWAVGLGLLLALLAATTAHGAEPHGAEPAPVVASR